MKTVAFFNNKGGVGKTTLVYHLSWMFSHLGIRTLAVDLDPQSNLTSSFLPPSDQLRLWENEPLTLLGAVQPLIDHLGDLKSPYAEEIAERLFLLPGDLGLSGFEDRLAEAWPRCLDDNPGNAADAFRVMTAFYRATLLASEEHEVQLALIDVGPNLGALNRAALIAADFVVVPLAADLYSLRGLRNLGPALRDWRCGWQTRRSKKTVPPGLSLPSGDMKLIGYVVQPAGRDRHASKALRYFINQFPSAFAAQVLGDSHATRSTVSVPGTTEDNSEELLDDPFRLATLRHYHSLMAMAHAAGKPVFALKPADGALGSHSIAAKSSYDDFKNLALAIAQRTDLMLPTAESLPEL